MSHFGGFAKMRRMKRRTWLRAAPLSVLLAVGIAEAMERAFLRTAIGSPNAEGKHQGDAMTGSAKVYELRIYHVVPGKLDSLVARFRDYTDKLFAKHGINSIAYWTALDEPVKSSTFFYILEHPSREAAAANWKAFQGDPEWKTVKAKSEENGKLVEKIDSTFLTLTDFSRPPRI
jgi:hypothetical protein